MNNEYEIFATTSTNILKTVLKDNALLNVQLIELKKENADLKDQLKKLQKEVMSSGESKQSNANAGRAENAKLGSTNKANVSGR